MRSSGDTQPARAEPLSIAFFGLPLAALLLAKDGVRFTYCGLSRASSLGTRRLRRLLPHVPIEITPNLEDAATRARVASQGGDLLVSWYWVKKIPQALRASYALGSVGVHPSLLPRHRGPDPVFWAIDRGDAETGVTAHRLADEYDTGAILAQERIQIDPTWNAWRLAKRLDRPSLRVLRSTVRRIALGEQMEELVQDERHVTDAPAPSEDELEIDWKQPSAAIERRVRAAAPWPGAYMFFGDEPLTLTRVRLASEVAKVLVPGEAWIGHDAQGARIVRVRTGDGALELLAARVENGEPETADSSGELSQSDIVDAMENVDGLE